MKTGRPIEPDSMKHTGRRFIFWASRKDLAKIARLAKKLELRKSEVMRKLLREFDEQEM